MNQAVGEREVELGGKKYKARPSFNAILEAESLAGASVLQIAQNLASNPRHREIAAVLYAFCKEGELNFDLSFEQVGELVVDEGLLKHAGTISYLLAEVLTPSGAQKKSGPRKK